jgi:hypothetical protein
MNLFKTWANKSDKPKIAEILAPKFEPDVAYRADAFADYYGKMTSGNVGSVRAGGRSLYTEIQQPTGDLENLKFVKAIKAMLASPQYYFFEQKDPSNVQAPEMRITLLAHDKELLNLQDALETAGIHGEFSQCSNEILVNANSLKQLVDKQFISQKSLDFIENLPKIWTRSVSSEAATQGSEETRLNRVEWMKHIGNLIEQLADKHHLSVLTPTVLKGL